MRFEYYYHNEKRTKDVELEVLLQWIREGKYEKRIEQMRGEVLANMGDDSDYAFLADECQVPIMLLTQSSQGYTGLVTIALPFGNDYDLRDTLRDKVNAMAQTACSFVSVGGDSLKVVIKYTLVDGGLPRTEDEARKFHAHAYYNAAMFLLQATRVTAVGMDGDLAHPCFMSVDTDAYFNPNSVVMTIEQPSEMPKKLSLPSKDEVRDLSRLPGYDERHAQILKFNVICRRLQYSASGDEDTFFNELASLCRKNGVEQELVVKCLLTMDCYRPYEMLIRAAFDVAYSSHPLGKGTPLSASLINQLHLNDFIHRRYVFRRNVITGSVEYMERRRYVTLWHPVNDTACNSICIAAHKAGIVAWDKDVRRYLDSDNINDYDPIMEWLWSLPAWDGHDRIGELAATVPTSMPEWSRLFRQWLRSMVAQWRNLNSLYGSSVVMMLIGGQGTGKSTFCKRLLPQELTSYYNDRIDFTSKREAERALLRFVLICMDEFDQITKSQTAYLKHILQKSDVKFRKMYQDDIEQRHRYASFCATTNSLTPLVDPTGSRRYMCVEVNGLIDNTYKIDYQQLYAQIIHELRQGEQTYFSAADEKLLQEINVNYTAEQPLESVVRNLIEVDKTSDATQMTSMEILNAIKRKCPGIRVDVGTSVQLGKILVRQRIPRRHTSRGWVYSVKIDE